LTTNDGIGGTKERTNIRSIMTNEMHPGCAGQRMDDNGRAFSRDDEEGKRFRTSQKTRQFDHDNDQDTRQCDKGIDDKLTGLPAEKDRRPIWTMIMHGNRRT